MVARPPDPFAVVAATLHPATRRVDLGDGRLVVRTPDRPDDPTGNAVHLTGLAPTPRALLDELAGAGARFPTTATPPVLARRPPRDDDHGDRDRRVALDVLVLDDAVRVAATWPRRTEAEVVPAVDARAWHAVTVLHRHAAPAGDTNEAAVRSRGGRDDHLRWWVAGRRRQREQGRARVLLARRFGTPVATLTLVWEPGAAVGTDAAGLAVLTDLVVHPAHRRLGVATHLAAQLLDIHLRDFPLARVATVAPASLTPALERRGWRVHDRLVEVTAG